MVELTTDTREQTGGWIPNKMPHSLDNELKQQYMILQEGMVLKTAQSTTSVAQVQQPNSAGFKKANTFTQITTSKTMDRDSIRTTSAYGLVPKNIYNVNNNISGSYLDGDETYFSRMQSQTVNQLDNVSFLRHGDIDEQTFRIKLDFVRDFRNVLNLLSVEDSIDYMECLERDTTRQVIAKLAAHKMKEGADSVKDLKVTDRHEGVTKEMIA